MDSILKKNVKSVHKLNAQAEKGSLKSFALQLQIGKICSEGYTHWKANKKALSMNREDLLSAYGYGKTYFGELRKSADVTPEDVGKYIDSMTEPTYSIKGLLKFLKPDTDKAPTLMSFSVAKSETEKGHGARLDDNLILTMNGDNAEIIESLKYMLWLAEKQGSEQLADIELTELTEA